ncbi:MAG: cell division protein FtsA [Candidatus Gracilibacteria bacterium]|nr:cell division protein FtsA [Candidatus Gracilibacteria bacterium]
MKSEPVYVGLDIGSSKVRTVIGVAANEEQKMPNVIGVGVSQVNGMRRGQIVDVEEVINSITASIEEAERMAGEPVDHASINLSSKGLLALNTKGFISVGRQDGEITEDDLARVLEAAQAVSIPPNQKVIQVIPKSYTVDDQTGILDPVGMTGIRLEVEAHVITSSLPNLKNITKCVHQTGVDIDDFVPNSLAAAEAVLSKKQKELGVVVIDLGAGCTDVAVFEEGSVLHTAVIPVGAAHITNDIAIGLRTSIDTAEKIKIEYGSCLPSEIRGNDNIDLSSISNIDSQVVSRKMLAEIIEARLQEIFALVEDELHKIDRSGSLPAGAVLTGAGVKTPGLVDLAKNLLSLPVQIGFPLEMGGLVDRIDDPAYATSIGLLLWSAKNSDKQKSYDFSAGGAKVFSGVKSWLKSFVS